MYKDQQPERPMMWETTVRKTQQQQQLPGSRRRGCGIFPAASVVPSGDGDCSGNSSGNNSPTTPIKPLDEFSSSDENNTKPYHSERLLPNGDFYTGLWSGNLPHGSGKYLWTDGCMYEGDWIHGKTTGNGKFSWPSGATYEGEFKSGFMDGAGTYTGAAGETYRGSWCMNLKHGRGKKSYANGDYYEGEWRAGFQDGHGRYVWKNSNEYSGGWKGGIIHGRGRLSWANGNEYSGEFEDGVPSGKGQFRWGDGSRYVGIWCRDGSVKKGVFFPSPGEDGDKDLTEVFDMDMREWKVCEGEKVSILPSQKTVDWSWLETEFLHKQAAWRSAKAVDYGARRRESSSSFHGGGLEAMCLWEPPERDGAGDGSGVRESNASGEMKWAPREIKKQGETISKGHKNYELMLNLQLGIRYSVGKPAPATTFDLKASAFDPKEKVWTKFPPEGTKQTPPHQSCEFRWKDYCPVVFRTLRKLFKIDAADYMISICGNDALRELSSPGKSGSFFYLTHDDRYMIKTVKKSEVKVLLRMLPAYYNHVRAFENTLVTKFFGLHCVKLTGATQKKVRFVIMGNLFCSDYPIHRRFDLKGSSHGRTTDKPEDQIDETTTLKDLDLNFLFRLQRAWFLEFQRQVDRDCDFLEQERIMDYSLLVGLHFRESATGDRTSAETSDYGSANEATPRLSRVDLDQFLCDPTRWATIRLGVNMPARVEQTQRSEGGSPLLGETFDVVLFFGIIDILQDYDISKKLEHAYKSIQYDPTSISAVDPKQYSRRFRDFIFKVFRDDP